MVKHRDAGTHVDAEVGVFPLPIDIILVAAHIETKLRTCKEEHVGHTANTEGIAQVDGDGDLLLCEAFLHTGLTVVIARLNLARTLVVKRGSIDTKSRVEQ